MMLFNLAVDNIRRNFKNYWAYFFSASFSVFVLYLFLSVTFNKIISGDGLVLASKSIFIIGAFLTTLFTAFFIWYSNSFFIKSRKKEFATYMLLGMSQKQTARLNFVENLVILLLSFTVGIVAGLLLNKLLIMLLLSIMKIQATVPFEVNVLALEVCAAIFGAVFILVSLHSARMIKKSTLVHLMNASKKAEKRLKVSFFTYVIGFFALVLIGYGYYLSIRFGTNMMLWFPIVGLVSAGTVLFFVGVATIFIHSSKLNKPRLYSGTRLITASQLSYRYRGNIGVLSTIAITTSVALCALLACCGVFGKTSENARMYRPFSAEYVSSDAAEEAFTTIMKAYPQIQVQHHETVTLLPATAVNKENGNKESVFLMRESIYNRIDAALHSNSKANLQSESDCLFVKRNSITISNEKDLADSVTIATGDSTTRFAIEDLATAGFISLDRFKTTLIVKDTAYDSIKLSSGESEFSVEGYMFTNEMLSTNFVNDLRDKMPDGSKPLTYYSNYMDGLKMMGVLLFVGVFIGLLFISATGSILYFRMSTEAAEDRDKYNALLKIGVSKKELRASIAKQLGIIFGAPFVVAALHAFAALFPLERFAGQNLKDVYLLILFIYALLYGFYYVLTLNKYNKTVNER